MKRLAKGLALSLATLLVLALAAEVLLRVSGYQPIQNPMGPRWMYRADPELGFALTPGFAGRHVHPEFEVRVEVDERGLRDIPYAGEPARRVLVLGDSMVFGYGVEAEETFCELLQQDLEDVEVVNAGVSGYGPNEQVVLLERLVEPLDPDVIVSSFFFANDLRDTLDPQETVLGGLVFTPAFASQIEASPLRRFALGWSRLLLTLETKRVELEVGAPIGRPLSNAVIPGPTDSRPVPGHEGIAVQSSPAIEAAWEAVRRCYARLAELAGERELLVLFMPVLDLVDEEAWARQVAANGLAPETVDRDLPFRRLSAICDELGLTLVDPRPALARPEGAWDLFFPLNQHLTAEGNRALADALRPALERAIGR